MKRVSQSNKGDFNYNTDLSVASVCPGTASVSLLSLRGDLPRRVLWLGNPFPFTAYLGSCLCTTKQIWRSSFFFFREGAGRVWKRTFRAAKKGSSKLSCDRSKVEKSGNRNAERSTESGNGTRKHPARLERGVRDHHKT